MIIANPVPEEYALSMRYVNEMIEEAVRAAEKEGGQRKEVNPLFIE